LKTLPVAFEEIYRINVYNLPENKEIHLKMIWENEDEENCAIVSYFQYGPSISLYQELIHQLVFQTLEEPCYDFLRTKEQLGYLVYISSWNLRNVMGGKFVIQSAKYTPEYLLGKIHEFIKDMKQKTDDLSDEDCKKSVNSILSIKRQVDMNLCDVKNRMHGEIVTHEYNFDRKEKSIRILETMISDQEHIEQTKKDMIVYFNYLFFNNVKQLNMEMICEKHREQQEKDSKITSESFTIPRSEIKLIDHVESEFPDLVKGTSV
jgi:secreted Zn-dependent insulinase-like peptidase